MAIKKNPVSPRQKMINLMYVVLMAMLAMNVSSEVLEGFSVVEESLLRTTANSTKQNKDIYDDFTARMKANPEKVKVWFDKATEVKNMADSLYNFATELKVAIVKEADGDDGDIENIKGKDNLNAASHVMLAMGVGKGKQLYNAINNYREKMLSMITDEKQRGIIADNLSTDVPKNIKSLGKNWQQYMFEGMPVAAAVTLLSKLQSDVRYAEGEVLHSLVANVDMKDIRVNKLSAFVIPEATTLVQGERFSAQIVMAAIDTTRQPEIYVNGQRMNLKNNTYQFNVSGLGEHFLSGYMTMLDGQGNAIRRDFKQKYTVVAPSATLSADLMNVLYAGFDNPMSVSVPGVPSQNVSLSMSGGSLRSKGAGKYIAHPSSVGKDVVFTVTTNQGGVSRKMGTFSFHVRKLPDPTPYVVVGTDRFRGGGLAKGSIMELNKLRAAIDDGLLDIEFRVTGFEAVFFDNMGNAVPIVGEGSSFTERQKATFRQLSRNKRFYITRITAVGPDGISRKLNSSMEVIVK